jgi:hypothetical protein
MHKAAWLFVLVLSACGSAASEPPPEEAPPPDETSGDERRSMTTEECEAQGGTVVGDIGDGATQRPDYVCPSGQPPIGSIPLGVEGSVCCPAAAAGE